MWKIKLFDSESLITVSLYLYPLERVEYAQQKLLFS